MFHGQLKAYQLKGMNWLASLYNQVRVGGVGEGLLPCYDVGPTLCRASTGSWLTRWGWARPSRALPCWPIWLKWVLIAVQRVVAVGVSVIAPLPPQVQHIWGPFLIVTPASTLHNWQQECSRFMPELAVLPYWGSPHERKTIRKFWSQVGRPAHPHPSPSLHTPLPCPLRSTAETAVTAQGSLPHPHHQLPTGGH